MSFLANRSVTVRTAMLGLALTSGCASWLPARIPMRVLHDDLPAGHARCLVVFLPGAGDDAEDFAHHGFPNEVRSRALSVDMVAADATMGYYFRGMLVDRLTADVVGPMLPRGYAQVWLVGMSMGGLGTLLYSMERPEQVTGVLALAPYLGKGELLHEVSDAGLAHWAAPAKATLTEDNYQRQLWRWLQAITSGSEKGPDLYLSWGAQDGRVGDGSALLAKSLPASHVATVPGGHDWGPWRTLFARFLDDSDFARACGPLGTR